MKLNHTLKGKNILFFCIQTFNYEQAISNKLGSLGANVKYYDERPKNSDFVKGIIRIKRNLYQKKINDYYQKILIDLKKTSFDYLLVIRGEIIPDFFISKFKENNPNCQLIFYTWDSFNNHGHATKILHYFDRKFTFDSSDARQYQLNFRPLFYLDDYKHLPKLDTTTKLYNILFIGTAHSDRYTISNEITQWANEHDLSSFNYYYQHSQLVYWYKRLFEKGFAKVDFKKLTFKSISLEKILVFYKNSQVILDIQHPNQTGLTMRTFETLGAGRKLITTNTEISKYSFYNEENIMIIDRNKIEIRADFFNSHFQPIDDDIFEAMSIDGWIHSLFIESKPNYWVNGLE